MVAAAAPTLTTHKAEREHGPCFRDGRLQWLSASVLTSGDTSAPGGCLRRVYFARVMGRREPTSRAMEIGTSGHARIEHYLTTGEKLLDQIELAGARFIQAPDPQRHQVEAPIAAWGLTAGGVPVVGHVDLIKHGREYVRDDGELGEDPDGTVEVIDWKFRGKLLYSVPGPALGNTTQMVTYGEAVARHTGAPWVRLSHVNFQTTGQRDARKSTTLLARDELAQRWNRVEGLARTIQHAVSLPTAEDVEPNTRACGAYGGCPHRSYCTAGRDADVEEFFGVTRAADLIALTQGTKEPAMTQPVNLLSVLNLPATPVASPPALLPQVEVSIAPPPNPPRIIFPEERAAAEAARQAEVAAESARLEEEAREAQRAAAALARSRADVAGVRETWGAIKAAGRGTPTLYGDAYRAYSVAVSDVVPQPGEALPGEGQLGAITLTDPAQFAQLARELGVTVPAAVLPPDAPPSDPAQAAVPVEGYSDPAAVAAYAEKAKRGRGRPKKADAGSTIAGAAALPPGHVDATSAAAVTAAVTSPAPVAPATPPAAAPVTPAPAPVPDGTAPGAGTPPMPAAPPAPGIVTGLVLLVDASANGPTAALEPYVDQICAMICKEYGVADVRLGRQDSPIGFGKWKGAVAAVARRMPPPAGTYTISTRHEIAAEVVEALRPLCAPGCYVAGVSR
jgi:hypothetical protein